MPSTKACSAIIHSRSASRRSSFTAASLRLQMSRSSKPFGVQHAGIAERRLARPDAGGRPSRDQAVLVCPSQSDFGRPVASRVYSSGTCEQLRVAIEPGLLVIAIGCSP